MKMDAIPLEEARRTAWPECRDILSAIPAAPEMPESLVPESFRAWILDAAERMQVPFDFIAAPALVAAGSLVGRSIAIIPKEQDDGF